MKAVIFDMDGVLTDSEPLINQAAVALFQERGVQVKPEDFLPFVGTGEDRYIGGVAELYGQDWDIPQAKKRTYEIYLELVPQVLQAFPGAVSLARACRDQGWRIAVASSADRMKIDANLQAIGMPSTEWDAVVAGEDVEHKKPAPDIFLKAAERLGVAPVDCVVIEDARHGVEAAIAAGMRCIAVEHTFPASELHAATHVVPHIQELSPSDLHPSSSPRDDRN